MINENIICGENSTDKVCILKSINLKQDFKFEFPIFKTRTTYEIRGKSIKINCINPCSKIEIKTPFDYIDKIEINLEDSSISGERVIFEFKGNVNLINSKISTTNKSSKMIKTTLNCISTTGYCYDYDKSKTEKSYVPINVREEFVIQYFENYINNRNYKVLKYNLGVGKYDQFKGGGQILINVDKMKVLNSILESNFRWDLKPKKIKNTNKQKNLLNNKIIKTSGTGGYIFLILDKLEIDNEKSFAEALGNCYQETDEFYYTSSSSGYVLIKVEEIREIKGEEINIMKLEDLAEKININNYCYTSSSGLMYIKTKLRNFLGFIYEKKESSFKKNFLKTFLKKTNIIKEKFDLKNEIIEENYENKFKLKIPKSLMSLDKIYIKNLTITLSIDSLDKELFIRKLEVDNSKKIVLYAPSSNIISLDSIILKNTLIFQNTNFLIKINLILNLYASVLSVKRLFLYESDLIMENSKIKNINFMKLRKNLIPKDLENLKNLEYIIKNLDELRKYYFFICTKSKSLSLISNSQINYAIVLFDSNEIHIENSKIKSNFIKKANVELQDNACGYSGTNNAGLGFFNLKIKNIFCIKSWILRNKSDILKYQNSLYTFSTTPIFISKKDFIKHDVFVLIGGFIKLSGSKIYLEGIIEAKGEDSSNIEKIYIGSSSGGIISLNFDSYEIAEDSLINISGGKGSYPLGSSGGGKILLNFKPPSNDMIIKVKDDKKKIYNTLETEFFNLGEKSFDTISNYDFPNPIWSFFYENKNFFLGKIYNSYDCEPGYYSSLCKKCPYNKFKPYYGFGECIRCPCEIENSLLYNPLIDVNDCPCKKKLFIETYFLEIILFCGLLACILIYLIQIIKMSNTENDLIFVLSIEDIANINYKIICEGNNTPENPLRTNLSDLNFINNSIAFCQKFNDICRYNKFEKYLLYFFFFLNYSPSFFLFQSFLKLGKIKKVKKLLKNFIFLSKDHLSYNLKYTISKNMNNLSIFFLNRNKKLNTHEFAIKFPYKLPIIGKGLFHYQFKIDLKNPLNIALIKHLKRNINKNYYDFNNILPKQLLKIKKNAKKIFPFDYFFSYLIVLFASLQINIPFKKFKKRILRLQIFLDEFNIYLKRYGFKITLFMKFETKEQKFKYNFFSLFNFSKDNNLKIIIYIFHNIKSFYPNFYFEIQRKKRNEPLSIIFPTISIDKNKSRSILIQKNDNIPKFNKKENDLSKILIIPKKNTIFSFGNKIYKILNNCFWIFFTYHTCKKRKLPYNFLKIIFLIILIFFKIYASQKISFNDYLIIIIIYPPFMDEITIVLVILQVFINKKKLDKFIIYSSFFSFIKSLIMTIIFYFFFNDPDQFALFYFFYSLIFLLLCYFNCYAISFDLFKKTKNIIQDIN